MSRLTALENKLMTRDPLSLVRRCLDCTKARCTNCLDWDYRREHETQKPRERRKQTNAKT